MTNHPIVITAAACLALSASTPAQVAPATVRVDSTYAGYGTAVLTDGLWIARGREPRLAWNDPNQLGNGGNTWVSGERSAPHWVEMAWPGPVRATGVRIAWSLADWRPRAFRIERNASSGWAAAGPWYTPTDRETVVPISGGPTRRLRLLTPPGCACERGFLALQEILAVFDPAPQVSGARTITPASLARMRGRLDSDVARLAAFPGAVRPLQWSSTGGARPAPRLTDGSTRTRAADLRAAGAVGVAWPIPHVVDVVELAFEGRTPTASALVPEIYDGAQWVTPLVRARKAEAGSGRWLIWEFEPIAAAAVRVRVRSGQASVTEMRVRRHMPASKDTWPELLTKAGQFERRVLRETDEPSFERVARHGLSMRTARVAVGLKDAVVEEGVGWDGTIMGRERLAFRIGRDRVALSEVADTVTRRLIDGWRPGVVVSGRIDDLAVRQTAFAVPAGGDPGRPALVIRLSVRNLGAKLARIHVDVTAESDRPGDLVGRDGLLTRGDDLLLVSDGRRASPAPEGGLTVALTIVPGAEAHADFVHPQLPTSPSDGARVYRGVAYADALAAFRRGWDADMATQTTIEVPEPRVNRMVKAVLAQVMVNADGDIMPYGSAPSVYEGGLFGIEESYPMLGLALLGLGRDAQRYMSATYLTPAFLAKAEKSVGGEERHQQYRNGLQPHYAVSLYRLTGDDAWMRRQLPLLRECAEWTMVQRRTTMVIQDGRRPLHWGLLPEWAYGGDIGTVLCYPLYPNLACWRGLVDTAWVLRKLGDPAAADRYAAEARLYRADIDRAIEGSYRADKTPPFLPLRLGADRPDEGRDYYQLFAGCLLDLEALPAGGKHSRWITSFMERDNRVLCSMPRFRPAIDPGGLDALYGKGIFLTKLHEGAVREFLLAFYAYLALNMEHHTFVSRESNVLYTSDLHSQSSFGSADITDPLPCASAVALHLVRDMLVTEERDGRGGYSGRLLLLAATPRAWLRDGSKVCVRRLPTQFGPVGLDVRSRSGSGVIAARVESQAGSGCREIRLRLPHPAGRPIRSVRVNGRSWTRWNRADATVALPAGGVASVEASY